MRSGNVRLCWALIIWRGGKRVVQRIFSQSKHTLSEVVAIRNNIYGELGIEIDD